MINIFNQIELKEVFEELNTHEERTRKQLAYRQLDIYSGNQDKYIYAKIAQMYGKEACDHIQSITGVELAKRIVNAEASLYKHAPERYYSNASEKELEQIAFYYEQMLSDEKLKTANRYFRLGNQCQLMVVPKNGSLKTRFLYNHQYSVVPMESDPDSAEMYIIPMQSTKQDRQDFNNVSDNINQRIADKNDSDLSRERYIVWTKDFNFMANGLGQLIDPITYQPRGFNEEEIKNPIKRIPIIDVCADKTLGFYAGGGNSLSDFSITFGVILSDLGEIVKLQGYSQPVISSLEEPKTISVGPHRVLWLKKDKNEPGDKDPSFQFATPSPDLQGSLSFAENTLRMFLTARGTDSQLVTSSQVGSYNSGFERLLAMVERAEATAEDRVLFSRVEQQYFSLIRDWHNYLMVTSDGLLDENKISMLNMNIEQSVKFHEPMQVMTQNEKESSVEKRLDLGLMSRKSAMIELYGVEEDKALEMIKEIDEDGIIARQDNTDLSLDEGTDNNMVDQKTKTQATDVNVQKTALNGAQVASLIQIVQSVATGNLPRESGISMIEAAFNYTREQATDIMDRSGSGFKPSGVEVPTKVNPKS